MLGLESCEQSNIKNGVRFYFSKLLDFTIRSQEFIIVLFSIHSRITIILFTGSSAWLSVSDNLILLARSGMSGKLLYRIGIINPEKQVKGLRESCWFVSSRTFDF